MTIMNEEQMAICEVQKTEAEILADVGICTAQRLLNEAAESARYGSLQADGSYLLPSGRAGQIYTMLIAASIKDSEKKRVKGIAAPHTESK